MSDDETKKDETTEDASAEETGAPTAELQDEAQPPAGPVADEGPSSSRDDAAGEDPSSAPPAGDAAEAEGSVAEAEPDDAPAEEEEAVADEGSSDDAPAAEKDEAPAVEAASEKEADPEDDLPWKERRRLQRSRRPSEAKPAQTPEERVAARVEARKKKAAERRKERAAAKAKRTPGTGTPPAERDSNAAKVRQGIVVSNKGDKSITVRIDFARRHPTYEKIVRRSRTLHAHDERNEAGEGDVVRVVETRPLSKTKRWRLVEVMEKAK
jgi:small subunit ribosomal protein S17